MELLVVCAILAILIGLLMATLGRARSSARQVSCLSNLRQIHAAFQMHVSDHGMRFPDPVASGMNWEAALQRYLTSRDVFVCPADEEIAPQIGSSYDWRDTGDVYSTIVGRPLAQVRGEAVLAFDALPAWHRPGMMNAVRVNGAAEAMDEQECLSNLQQSPLRKAMERPEPGSVP